MLGTAVFLKSDLSKQRVTGITSFPGGIEILNGRHHGEYLPVSEHIGVGDHLTVPTILPRRGRFLAIFWILSRLPLHGQHGDERGRFVNQLITHRRQFLFLQMQAELALGILRAGLHLILVVEAQKGHGGQRHFSLSKIIEKISGDIGALG